MLSIYNRDEEAITAVLQPLRQIAASGQNLMPVMMTAVRVYATDDVTSFQLETQFSLIYTYGAVFQHLLNRSDQEAMLARVHEHLALAGAR